MKGLIVFLVVALVAAAQGLGQKDFDSELDDAILLLQQYTAIQGDLGDDWPLIEDDIEDDAAPIVLSQTRSVFTILKTLLEIKKAIQQAINIKNCVESAVNTYRGVITEFLNAIRNLKDAVIADKAVIAKCLAIGGDKPSIAQILQRKICLDKQIVIYAPELLKDVRRVVVAFKNIVKAEQAIQACIPVIG